MMVEQDSNLVVHSAVAHEKALAALTQDSFGVDANFDLSGYHYIPNEEQLAELAEAIHTAPRLTQLHLKFMDLDDTRLSVIADALTTRNDLKCITLTGNGYTDAGATDIFEALQNHPELESIIFGGKRLDTEAASLKLCDLVAGCPNLSQFIIGAINFTPETEVAMANALQDKQQLSTLVLWSQQSAPSSVYETLKNGEYPQLLNFNENTRKLPNIAHNAQIYGQKTNHVVNGQPVTDFAAIAAIFSLDSAYQHSPYVDSYHDLLAGLPQLPADEALTATNLFSAKDQLCPAENPLTWKTYPDLLAQLAVNGEWENAMCCNTPSGANLVQCALAFGDVSTNLDFLQSQGQSIQNILTTPCAQNTTSIWNIIERRGAIGECFQYDRWKDQKPEAFVAAVKTLPAHAQGYVKGYHSTQHQLQNNQNIPIQGR